MQHHKILVSLKCSSQIFCVYLKFEAPDYPQIAFDVKQFVHRTNLAKSFKFTCYREMKKSDFSFGHVSS